MYFGPLEIETSFYLMVKVIIKVKGQIYRSELITFSGGLLGEILILTSISA